jgi:GTPase Era involved in 16S rRNA processing
MDNETMIEYRDKPFINEIWVDMEKASEEIHVILDDLMNIKNEFRIKQALGGSFISKLQQRGTDIRKRLSDDFSVVVIGDFKRGKSTFINALLKEDLVTTNVTPETVTINRVSYGEEYAIEAVLKDARRMKLEKEQMARENLDKLLEKLPSEVEYVDIRVPLPELQGVRIVDTPGVGDLLKQFDNQVKDYLIYADAVIYMVSALSPLSDTEQTFLRAALLPQEFSKLIIVVNMLDCMEDAEETSRILDRIQTKASQIFPNTSVYGVSALDEFCRLKGLKRPNENLSGLLEDNFRKMRTGLEENLMTKHEMIQLQRVVSVLNFSIKDLENHISLIQEALNLERAKVTELISQYEDKNSDLMKKIDQHKESLKMDIREMQEVAAGWMVEFIDRLEREIRSSYQSYSFEGIQKHFHFFMMDIMKEAMNECVTAHLEKLSELLKAKSSLLEGDLSLINATNLAKSTIRDVSWTTIDNGLSALSVAADIIPGLGMLVGLGQMVLGFGKKGMEKDQRQSYIQSVLDNFPAIRDSILQQIRSIYNSIIHKALDILDATYQKQIAASLDAIKQAQVIAESNEQDKKSILEGIEMAGTIAREAREKLESLESRFA